MKSILLSLSLVATATTLNAQAPAGSKLAAEQAFTKELNRVFAYAKEHPTANAYAPIKAPSVGQSGLLTLTFNHTSAEGNCREVATIPLDKIVTVMADSVISLKVEGDMVQKIRLCSGKQPTHTSETTLAIGTVTDGVAAKGFATDIETALRKLQTFYK